MNDDAAVHPPGFLADPTRFLFFTGKGGVGKTSVACENYAQSTTKLPAAPTNIRATMMTPMATPMRLQGMFLSPVLVLLKGLRANLGFVVETDRDLRLCPKWGNGSAIRILLCSRRRAALLGI